MRTNRAISIPLLLGALVAGTASASAQGGSSYTILNLGDLRPSVSSAASGRGGVETAINDAGAINSLNPAGWSRMRSVVLQGSVGFEQYQISQGSLSTNQNNTKLQDFSIAFPWSETYGGTLAFSIRPYSTVGYAVTEQRTVPGIDPAKKAQVQAVGSGGISQMTLGTSFSPVEWLDLGVVADRLIGTVSSTTSLTFPTLSLDSSHYSTVDKYAGWGVRTGLIVRPIPELSLGASFTSGIELERQQTKSNVLYTANGPINDTLAATTTTVTIPPRFSFGASYRTGKFQLAAEAVMQAWGSEQFATAQSSSRFAVGLERLPTEAAGASAFDRWTFRFGGYYDKTYYNVGGTGIYQMAGTIGVGIPLKGVTRLDVGTDLNLGVEIGTRGTSDNNLTQELFGRVNIGVSISELWFVRTRR